MISKTIGCRGTLLTLFSDKPTCIYKITQIWLFDHTLGAYVFFYICTHLAIWSYFRCLCIYSKMCVYIFYTFIYIYVQTEFRCLFLGLLAPTTCTGLSMFYIFERPLWGRTGQMCMYIQCMCICICIYIYISVRVCVCVLSFPTAIYLIFAGYPNWTVFFPLLDKLECYVKKGILSPCSCKVLPRFAIRETYLEVQLSL